MKSSTKALIVIAAVALFVFIVVMVWQALGSSPRGYDRRPPDATHPYW